MKRAPRLAAALLIPMVGACSADKAVVPPDEPSVATSLVAISSPTSAYAGSPVANVPRVIVKDQRGLGMGGIVVTFTVASGGGSITGGTTMTTADGVASVGSWTLGKNPGANTLLASVTGVPPILFAATGTFDNSTCHPELMTPTIGITNGNLATTDCLSDGVYVDFHSTSLTGETAYVFKLAASFDTYLFITTATGYLNSGIVAENDDESAGSTNSSIKVLLPGDTYVIAATSREFGVTGAYMLSAETTSVSLSGCEAVYTVQGISTAQTLESGDCIRTNAPVYADELLVYLEQGQAVNLSMTSNAIDSHLELLSLSSAGIRTLVATNDNADTTGNKNARILYMPTTTGYYVVRASTAVNGQTGGYTLAIQ